MQWGGDSVKEGSPAGWSRARPLCLTGQKRSLRVEIIEGLKQGSDLVRSAIVRDYPDAP